jgi:hypothetical protein
MPRRLRGDSSMTASRILRQRKKSISEMQEKTIGKVSIPQDNPLPPIHPTPFPSRKHTFSISDATKLATELQCPLKMLTSFFVGGVCCGEWSIFSARETKEGSGVVQRLDALRRTSAYNHRPFHPISPPSFLYSLLSFPSLLYLFFLPLPSLPSPLHFFFAAL